MGQVARSGDENGLQDMTTPAQTTLLHAAELLEADAKSFRLMFYGSKDARDYCNDALCTALELRLLAKRIIPITAVSPAPSFERKENG